MLEIEAGLKLMDRFQKPSSNGILKTRLSSVVQAYFSATDCVMLSFTFKAGLGQVQGQFQRP